MCRPLGDAALPVKIKENADLSRMKDALKRVQEAMHTTRVRYDKTEAEYQRLAREVAELEQQRGIRHADGAA